MQSKNCFRICLLALLVHGAIACGASFDPTTTLVGVATGSLNAAKTQLTITSSDVPDNSTILYGPLQINFPSNQNLNLAYPYRGGTDAAGASHTSLIHFPGVIGVTVAGLVIYAPPNLSVITKNGSSWYYDANQAKINGEDTYGGHCAGTGQYHYHDIAFVTNNSWVGVTGFTGGSYRKADGHSKLLGWSADGYPIYGPYGYVKPTDSTSGTQLMVSGYTTTNTGVNRPSSVTATVLGAVNNSTTVVFASDPGALGLNPGMRITTNSAGLAANTFYILNQQNVTYTGGGHPPYSGAANSVLLNSAVTIPSGASLKFEYLAGMFCEDNTFTNTGTLDVYNGRYCVTPEFPNGTYAYFMTQDAVGKGVYPYMIGQFYYGSTIVSANYTWSGGSGTWATGTAGWSAGAWADGNNVIVGSGSDTAGTITVSSTINPAAIIFGTPSSGKYTLAVNGNIATAGTIVTASGINIRGTGNIARTIQTDSTSVVWPGAATLGSTVPAGGESLTVAALDMHNGGKLSIAFNANSATSTQKLSVTGSCKLGGTLSLGVPAGTTTATTFTVLTSGSALSGSFATVLLNGAAVTGTSPVNVQYNANSVTVTLTGSVTAATLDSFTAQSSGAGIELSWEALSEFQNAGFNVYRRGLNESDWTCANPSLIPGRITAPDAKRYTFYDWTDAGTYEYKLESIGIANDRAQFSQIAGPICADCTEPQCPVTTDDINAVINRTAMDASAARTANTLMRLAASIEPLSSNATAVRSLTGSTASVRPPVTTPADSENLAAAPRWFSAASPAPASAYTAAKLVYISPGLTLIPQSSLPAGFDIHHIALQREGRALSALAVAPAGLLVYLPGYRDDYTDKDAVFLRRVEGDTAVSPITAAAGLFTSTAPIVTTSPAVARADYHDIYFDFQYRPYNFAPWFSKNYLTQGTTQNFALNTPNSTADAASLTLNLWSLTQDDTITPDHGLLVLVNNQPIGQHYWDGGNKMMQLTFAIPAGLLVNGTNTISLATPAIPGLDASTQIAFLHSLAIDYTRQLEGSKPVTLVNNSTSPQLYELNNIPSAGAYVVDTRVTDRAALVPTETQTQPDGTLRLRFIAQNGGTGTFLVVPVGQESKPLSITARQVKPLRLTGTYLATGPNPFATGVQPLLTARAKQGIRSTFVDQEELFDYYNHGRYGPAGIQNAVRSARPKYLLLLGRTTYDYLNFEGANVDPLCPTFLIATNFWSQTTSDALFGDLGRGDPEVAVGRLPVNNPAELAVAINRILAYKGAPSSGIRVHAVADRADPSSADFGALLDTIAQSHPDLFWDRNYLGSTCQSAPEVTAKLAQAAGTGADWILYEGHGNAVRLGKESPRILQTDSAVDTVQDWTGNAIFLQSTCTAHWMAKNESGFRSIAIEALTQPQGGISASIGSSTYISVGAGADFMKLLLTNAAAPGTRWGDAVLRTQQQLRTLSASNVSGLTDAYADVWRTESLFGDPAMPIYTGRTPHSERAAPRAIDAVALARSLERTVVTAPSKSQSLTANAIQHARVNGDRTQTLEIRDMLSAPDTSTRLAAMLTLSQWGDDASRAVFESAIQSDSPQLQIAAREALNRLDALERFLPYPQQNVATLANALKSDRPRVRHEAAAALLRFGPVARTAMEPLASALAKLDGASSLSEISPYLETLRQIGGAAAPAGPVLNNLLDERAPLYTGRSKHAVSTLRSHLLVTLADIGQAHLALPAIVDMLANSNQPVDFNFAAAARAAGTLGESAAELVPFLARALSADFSDGLAAPGTHGERALPVIVTTGRIEALRALAKIGHPSAAVLPQLEALLQDKSDLPPDVISETQSALSAIRKATSR